MRQTPGETWRVPVTVGTTTPPDSRLSNGGVLFPLYRIFMTHDGDGNELGLRRERVNDVGRDGELRPAVITVLRIDRNAEVAQLDLETAKACGFRTTSGLRNAWTAQHPRSPICHLVYFVLGDVRDRPLYLNPTGQAGGDYTRNRARSLDGLETLSREQVEALSSQNRQKDMASQAKASAKLRENETLAQRIARLELASARFGDEVARALRPNFRVIDQRLKRAEKRKP